MKTTKSVMALLLVLAFVLSAGCSSTPKQSDFLNGYYSKLKPAPAGGGVERWLKPGVDFSKYNKLMVDSVVFYLAPDSKDKSIDPEDMKELSDAFNLELVNALKDKYPIVADPGPDVLRIKVAITGIKKSKPVMSAVSSVLPVGLGISVIKKGTTGAWTGSGQTNAEMYIFDSETNDVIGAAKGEKAAGFTERFSKYGSAKEAFKFWAERLRTFLDEAHGIKK